MTTTYGRPIAVFWFNLTTQGARFTVNDDGQLVVRLPEVMRDNTYLQQEIIKRRQLLIKLLDKRGLDPLIAQYVGEPLNEDEATTAATLAEKFGLDCDIYQIGEDFIVGNVRAAPEQRIRVAVDNFGKRNGIENLSQVMELVF